MKYLKVFNLCKNQINENAMMCAIINFSTDKFSVLLGQLGFINKNRFLENILYITQYFMVSGTFYHKQIKSNKYVHGKK